MSFEFFTFVSRGEFVKALRCVSLETASRSLAQQCRYNGATSRFYSVAQHCVLLSRLWPADDPRAVWGLLHDLHECVIGDITRPTREKVIWKWGEELLGTSEMESRLLAVVQKRFALEPIPEDVHAADSAILIDEMRLFFPEYYAMFPDGTKRKALGVGISPVDPCVAASLFVERAAEVGVDRLFVIPPKPKQPPPAPTPA